MFLIIFLFFREMIIIEKLVVYGEKISTLINH